VSELSILVLSYYAKLISVYIAHNLYGDEAYRQSGRNHICTQVRPASTREIDQDGCNDDAQDRQPESLGCGIPADVQLAGHGSRCDQLHPAEAEEVHQFVSENREGHRDRHVPQDEFMGNFEICCRPCLQFRDGARPQKSVHSRCILSSYDDET
jgi:hypothetical protein